jgi:hypothetical protein
VNDAATLSKPTMIWQQKLREDDFAAKDFMFEDGGRIDLRLAYQTLGRLAPDKANVVLLLHGTIGSGRRFQPSNNLSSPMAIAACPPILSRSRRRAHMSLFAMFTSAGPTGFG